MRRESSRRRAATAMPKILACGRPSRNSVARMVPLPKVARGEEFAALAVGPNDRVFVLTGAGISAESGVRTFRDAGGLWEEHRIEDVAMPAIGRRSPTRADTTAFRQAAIGVEADCVRTWSGSERCRSAWTGSSRS